jgi:uncharacterized protein
MIIDAHTHTPRFKDAVPESEKTVNTAWRPDRPVAVPVCWSDYLEGQKPAEKSIVFNIARQPDAAEEESLDWYSGDQNDATATFANAYPKRLIGFMSLHPHADDCMDQFERCRTDLGLQGVKLGPNYQNFDPLEARALAIYGQAEKYDLPIMFHQGTSPNRDAPIRYAHPLVVDEIAMRFPDLKIVMAHLGHPWQVDTCVVVRKHPNVYADLSANFYRPYSFWEQMVKATEWNVLPKIFFGTDFPVTTVQETIDHLRRINDIVEGTPLPKVSADAIEEIIHRDSLTLLGLA